MNKNLMKMVFTVSRVLPAEKYIQITGGWGVVILQRRNLAETTFLK